MNEKMSAKPYFSLGFAGVSALGPVIPPSCFQVVQEALLFQLQNGQIDRLLEFRVDRGGYAVAFGVQVVSYFDCITRVALVEVLVQARLEEKGILSFGLPSRVIK